MSTKSTIQITFALASLVAVSGAGAEVLITDNYSVFSALVESQSGSILEESFNGYEGFYASGLTGGSGDIAWTASADGGLYAHAGVMSTNVANREVTMVFSSANVFAIGGDFFNTNFDFGVVPGLVRVTSEGVTYAFNSNGTTTSFAGFVSTSGSIQSISFSPFGAAAEGTFASAGSVVVGVVPSPAVLALGAIAGMFGRRRRN